MSGCVGVPLRVLVVEREQELPARLIERGPAVLQNRFFESCPVATHVVRRDELVLGEHGADLSVDASHLSGTEWDGHRQRRQAWRKDTGRDGRRRFVLSLDLDRYREMARVVV